MLASHPPIPFDPQGLVAPNILFWVIEVGLVVWLFVAFTFTKHLEIRSRRALRNNWHLIQEAKSTAIANPGNSSKVVPAAPGNP
jgi:hypothetical protein